ncbi:MAG: large conductance mechanosensitive channel protein MscL [Sphingobacteriaceae bacterium]|nr:large conductance mechanosensitive channel protein MscL [Cytophagaceae bacterium]
MLKEFKDFIMRGNVMDLAVGVIIGAGFGKIVDSAVTDLIMPLVGIAGDVDFSNRYLPLSDKVQPGLTLAAARAQGPVFAYGNFFTALINFIILAFIIFWIIKGVNRLMEKKATAPEVLEVAPTKEEVLLTEIRDALRAQPLK